MIINEERTNLAHDEGKEASLLGLDVDVASVHENVLAARVTVEVAEYL